MYRLICPDICRRRGGETGHGDDSLKAQPQAFLPDAAVVDNIDNWIERATLILNFLESKNGMQGIVIVRHLLIRNPA